MPDILAAGPFCEWLEAMRAVLRGERDADVPCGNCVGCCVSSYPIALRPADRVALDRVPAHLLRMPAQSSAGLAWMGYREDGSCPMLCAGACSIYTDRPQTCRDYDCRIYAATGLLPDGERPIISEKVQAWRFGIATGVEQAAAAAVQRAADFIRSHGALFPDAVRADSATAVAVLAVKTYELFLDPATAPGIREPSLQQAVQRVMDAARAFHQVDN